MVNVFFLNVKIVANYDLIETMALTTNPYANFNILKKKNGS
jgi:hypothetical protein